MSIISNERNVSGFTVLTCKTSRGDVQFWSRDASDQTFAISVQDEDEHAVIDLDIRDIPALIAFLQEQAA